MRQHQKATAMWGAVGLSVAFAVLLAGCSTSAEGSSSTSSVSPTSTSSTKPKVKAAPKAAPKARAAVPKIAKPVPHSAEDLKPFPREGSLKPGPVSVGDNQSGTKVVLGQTPKQANPGNPIVQAAKGLGYSVDQAGPYTQRRGEFVYSQTTYALSKNGSVSAIVGLVKGLVGKPGAGGFGGEELGAGTSKLSLPDGNEAIVMGIGGGRVYAVATIDDRIVSVTTENRESLERLKSLFTAN